MKPRSARAGCDQRLAAGELYLNGGKKEKAIDNLKKAEGMFREMGMDGWLVKAREISESI